MFGFIIKKSFCDDWDNLLSVVIVNLISVTIGLLLLLLCANITPVIKDLDENTLVPFFIMIGALLIGSIFISIINFAFGELAAEIANFNGIRLVDFFKAIPGVLKDAVLYGIMIAVMIIISLFCLDFYFLKMQSLAGFFIGSLFLWVDLFLILSLQWFVPIRSLMKNDFKKCFKKCLLIFFDNTGFSILMAIHNLVLIAASVFLVGFFPSFAGIMIAKTNALRLRLYKYDYLEEHPELQTKAERSKIPWDELIYDDVEALGPRKLRSFLFPWKE